VTLELVVIALASLAMTLAGASATAVGVWVLIRTARVSALEQGVDNLGEMLRSFRNRDARRETRARAPSVTKGAKAPADVNDGTEPFDVEAKKREIYSAYMRGAQQ